MLVVAVIETNQGRLFLILTFYTLLKAHAPKWKLNFTEPIKIDVYSFTHSSFQSFFSQVTVTKESVELVSKELRNTLKENATTIQQIQDVDNVIRIIENILKTNNENTKVGNFHQILCDVIKFISASL